MTSHLLSFYNRALRLLTSSKLGFFPEFTTERTNMSDLAREQKFVMSELDWLINVAFKDISVIYVTAHTSRYAGRLKMLDPRSGSQCHRHFARPSTDTGPPFFLLPLRYYSTCSVLSYRVVQGRLTV